MNNTKKTKKQSRNDIENQDLATYFEDLIVDEIWEDLEDVWGKISNNDIKIMKEKMKWKNKIIKIKEDTKKEKEKRKKEKKEKKEEEDKKNDNLDEEENILDDIISNDENDSTDESENTFDNKDMDEDEEENYEDIEIDEITHQNNSDDLIKINTKTKLKKTKKGIKRKRRIEWLKKWWEKKVNRKEKKKLIIEAFSMDCTFKEAALYAWIEPVTIYKWFEKDEEFKERCKIMRKMPVLMARMEVVNGISWDKDFALKYLERKRKKEFSIRTEQWIDWDIDVDMDITSENKNINIDYSTLSSKELDEELKRILLK